MVPPFDGITVLVCPLELELELELEELEELELLLDISTHGGTISVVTLLLAGRTSWFTGEEDDAFVLDPPPGVTRIVLAGGGIEEELEELDELDELEELELELWLGGMHGWIATVSCSAPFGISIRLEPGGGAEPPLDWVTCASEQGGTASVRLAFWGGTTIARTPGSESALATASEELELELEDPPLLLPPHAAMPTAIKPATPTIASGRLAAEPSLVIESLLAFRPRAPGRLPRAPGPTRGPAR